MRHGALEGSRPALGRRPKPSAPVGGPSATDAELLSKVRQPEQLSEPALPVDVESPSNPNQNKPIGNNGAKIQTTQAATRNNPRPFRLTRNSNPAYVDALAMPG